MRINGLRNELLYNSNNIVIEYPKDQFPLANGLIESVGNVDKDAEYDIIIKKHRKRRSLNANAYSWTLTGKLADKLRMSKDECHSLMLARYGQTAKDSNGNNLIVSVLSSIPESDVVAQLGYVAPIPTHGFIGDKEFIHYRVLKGSHDFDSREMSIFIDGIVSECKEQGIETMTPKELDELKRSWAR